jgi:hypothetical protein
MKGVGIIMIIAGVLGLIYVHRTPPATASTPGVA